MIAAVGDLGSIFVLALTAMFTPALLAAVTVMMVLPNTERLMLGYLLGAYLTSISVGLLIVFSLHGSGAVSTAQNTLSPAADVVLGAIALAVGLVLGTGRGARIRERRRKGRSPDEVEPKKQSLPERMLSSGSPRVTFAVGVLLTFPGASYLAALNRMADLDAPAAPTVLLVVGFCVVQLTLLEVPLVGYVLAPERTQEGVVRFRAWLARNGRRGAAIAAATIGVLLIVRGVIGLLA
jgi:hypothetical protein